MSAPYTILLSWPSLCQKLSKLVEIWRSSDEKNFDCFFRDMVYILITRYSNWLEKWNCSNDSSKNYENLCNLSTLIYRKLWALLSRHCVNTICNMDNDSDRVEIVTHLSRIHDTRRFSTSTTSMLSSYNEHNMHWYHIIIIIISSGFAKAPPNP